MIDSTTAASARPPRLDSLDVFRGLTMLLMLFANDLSDPDLGHIANVPGWLKHMPAGVDGMTFVDVIFPAFLFGAGLSIPLALGRRLTPGGVDRAFVHVLTRSLGLAVIGLGMVNTYRFHPTAMPISPALWEFLFFIAVILVWQQSPPNPARPPSPAAKIRRTAGVIALIALALVYRGSDGGEPTWMRTSWWGILTAIGIAYFINATAYLVLKKSLAGMVGLLALLTALNIGDRSGALPILDPLRTYFSAGGLIGGLPSILTAGLVAGLILFEDNPSLQIQDRLLRLWGVAGALFFAGWLLKPPFGISKPADTPAWCLLSAAICCVLFAFLYWLIDVKRIVTWAKFLLPAGRQPLLVYFLPHLFYSLLAIIGVTWLEHHLNTGWLGILRSLTLAFAFVALTALLTRFKLNLKL